MADILFIKTSSLGDVVHHMPALTEAARHRPDARFTWVVEEAFAPLARLHPAAAEVIPVATRRWRRQLGSAATFAEMRAFVLRLRARRYDAVIDTQGLARTGLIAHLAHGPRHGYDLASIKERLATIAYDLRHAVAHDLHAVARNRILTGRALGYVAADDVPDYGLDRASLAGSAGTPYVLLFHATAWTEKLWREDDWIAVGRALAARGLDLVLPWGSDDERARAERLAAALPRARVQERLPLDRLARVVAGASLVVGVDTGLLHLAAALGVPLVAVFVATEPGLTGPVGRGPIAVAGGNARVPSAEEVVAAVERVTVTAGA